MKIVQVASGYPPAVGGLEEHVRSVSEGLVARGHEVEVHATDPSLRDSRMEVYGNVTVVRHPALAPQASFFYSPKLERALRDRAAWADIVHAHNYHALPAFHALRASRGRPFVFTAHFHGGGHTPIRDALHLPYRLVAGARLFSEASKILAVSNAERQLVVERFRPPIAVEVVPNGVDLKELNASSRVPETCDLIMMGRLERYKRVEYAMRAVKLLPGRTLRVFGDGPDRQRLEGVKHRERMDGVVSFAGRVSREELLRSVAGAHVVLALSEHEAFGLTVLEAVASGSYVVASPIPAHEELAAEFPNNIHILTDLRPESIAHAVQGAKQKPPVPPAIDRYGWPAIAERIERVYEEARR